MIGRDAPSIWGFVTVILVYLWLKDKATKAGNAITKTFELGENSAGPLQDETTEDIRRMNRFVQSIHVDWTRCPKPKTYYDQQARSMYNAMVGGGTNEEALFAAVKGRNPQELRAIAKAFGVKEETSAGFTMFSGTLFDWFDRELSDGLLGNDLSKMKQIFKPTGLWD